MYKAFIKAHMPNGDWNIAVYTEFKNAQEAYEFCEDYNNWEGSDGHRLELFCY